MLPTDSSKAAAMAKCLGLFSRNLRNLERVKVRDLERINRRDLERVFFLSWLPLLLMLPGSFDASHLLDPGLI